MAGKRRIYTYVPVTPGRTVMFELRGKTRKKAWNKLLHATQHMPYSSIGALKHRGYTIERWLKSEVPF